MKKAALTYIYTVPCVKYLAGEKLPYNIGSLAGSSVMT